MWISSIEKVLQCIYTVDKFTYFPLALTNHFSLVCNYYFVDIQILRLNQGKYPNSIFTKHSILLKILKFVYIHSEYKIF